MTAAKVFPAGTSISDAMSQIVSNADEVIKGACVGMFVMLELMPSCGVNLSTVIGVDELGTDRKWDGYMVSIMISEAAAQQPYEKVCEQALLQRFIGVDNEGRAVKFMPVGKQNLEVNRWLN